jgi:hypothetical protein
LGTAKTVAKALWVCIFIEVSWDFVNEIKKGIEDIWWINEGQNYPRLWWEND